MEIICVDKQTFEELRVRFCDFEERMTRVCRPAEDLGLKNWLDNQEVRCASHQQEDTTGISQQRDIAFQPYQEQAVLQA